MFGAQLVREMFFAFNKTFLIYFLVLIFIDEKIGDDVEESRPVFLTALEVDLIDFRGFLPVILLPDLLFVPNYQIFQYGCHEE